MMRVFVLGVDGKPLGPCHPARARLLLKRGKAKVVRTCPFTIQLTYVPDHPIEPNEIELAIDPGYEETGIVLVLRRKKKKDVVIFQAVLYHRKDLSAGLAERRNYRHARRHRVKRTKLKGKKKRNKRYRKPTWKLGRRAGQKGWLPPSVRYREEEKRVLLEELRRLCPITGCVYEVASFDVQKMKEPFVQGKGYQEGLRRRMQEKNLRAAVKARDGYTCQLCGQKKKPWELQGHHIVPRRNPYRGTDTAEDLISLCGECHEQIKGRELEYASYFQEKIASRGLFRETVMQVGRNYFWAVLGEQGWGVEGVYGYQTAVWREEMGLSKSHLHDGLAMLMRGGKGWEEGKGEAVAIYRRKGRVAKLRFGYKHGDVVSGVRKGERYVGWVSSLHVQRKGGKEYPCLHVRLADGRLVRNVGLRGLRLIRRSGRLIYVGSEREERAGKRKGLFRRNEGR